MDKCIFDGGGGWYSKRTVTPTVSEEEKKRRRQISSVASILSQLFTHFRRSYEDTMPSEITSLTGVNDYLSTLSFGKISGRLPSSSDWNPESWDDAFQDYAAKLLQVVSLWKSTTAFSGMRIELIGNTLDGNIQSLQDIGHGLGIDIMVDSAIQGVPAADVSA